MNLRFNVSDKVMHQEHGLCQVYARVGDKFMGEIDADKILGNKHYIIGKDPIIKDNDHLFSVFDNELTPV